MKKGWRDISVSVRDGMVHWPDNPPVKIRRILDMKKGDRCTLSTLSFGSHTATHMDAPAHFLKGGAGIDRMPFEVAIGPARVIEILDKHSVKPDELKRHKIKKGERILFKTLNSSRCWRSDRFIKDFVHIPGDSAHLLAKIGPRLVGIDYLSVGGFHKDGRETHRALLSKGVWILEGVNLSGVNPGRYKMICLPLRLPGADGAPARAILRPL